MRGGGRSSLWCSIRTGRRSSPRELLSPSCLPTYERNPDVSIERLRVPSRLGGGLEGPLPPVVVGRVRVRPPWEHRCDGRLWTWSSTPGWGSAPGFIPPPAGRLRCSKRRPTAAARVQVEAQGRRRPRPAGGRRHGLGHPCHRCREAWLGAGPRLRQRPRGSRSRPGEHRRERGRGHGRGARDGCGRAPL